MMLLEYDGATIKDATWVPVGGAVCGRGCHGILFGLKDWTRVVESLNSDSVAEKDRMVEYLSHLICRFLPGEQSHEAVLPE
jgi:hypothetical protein